MRAGVFQTEGLLREAGLGAATCFQSEGGRLGAGGDGRREGTAWGAGGEGGM